MNVDFVYRSNILGESRLKVKYVVCKLSLPIFNLPSSSLVILYIPSSYTYLRQLFRQRISTSIIRIDQCSRIWIILHADKRRYKVLMAATIHKESMQTNNSTDAFVESGSGHVMLQMASVGKHREVGSRGQFRKVQCGMWESRTLLSSTP